MSHPVAIFCLLFLTFQYIQGKNHNLFFPVDICPARHCNTRSFFSDPPKLANIGYIGGSYDIFKGNPLAIGEHDPGFQGAQNIFEFTYNEKKTTTDGSYLIPDGTTVNSVESCSFSFSSSTTKNIQSYSESLKVHVDANFKYYGASFSASSDYQNVQETTSGSKHVYVSSHAECQTYGASIDDAPLSQAFIDDVKHLPVNEPSLDSYTSFIDIYGTHVASSIMMGGRYGLRSKFTSSSYNSMASNKFNIEAAGGYSGLISVSASLATETEKEQAATFEKNRMEVQIFQLGGKPPVSENGSAFEWAQTVKDIPMPLTYSLTEIYKYLNSYYFPNDETLSNKRHNLQMAMVKHCEQYVPDAELCHLEYGPNNQSKLRVSLGHEIIVSNMDDLTTFSQISHNSHMRSFGAVKGPYYEIYPVPSPFVMADGSSTNSDITREPIGIIGVSGNNLIKRYKCPNGFSTVTDQMNKPPNYLPPHLPCIANHCLAKCNKGSKCKSGPLGNNDEPCYYIVNGYLELGGGDVGFFRDLSINDPTTPESDLFKCLTYECLEVM